MYCAKGLKDPRGRMAMLSPREMETIKAEIKRLEEIRDDTTDSGIRKHIQMWLDEKKRELAAGQNPDQSG